MSSNHLLSKTTFLRSVQCHKSLYLNRYKPALRDPPDPSQEAVFRTGKEVHALARELFPGGVVASSAESYDPKTWLRKTRTLMGEGVGVLFEAAFEHDQVLVVVDILERVGAKWKAFEVKSSTSVKDPYDWDVAVQYHILTNAGIELDDFSVLHIDNNYVRHGDLDLEALFTSVSMLELVKEMGPEVSIHIEEAKAVLSEPNVPEIDIGPYCDEPYACDFMGYCWRHIPDHSVFTVTRMKKDHKFGLYHDGIMRMEDIPEDFPLNKISRVHVEGHKFGRSIIDQVALQAVLGSLKYPLYFLDFETYNPAIPPFDRTKPYGQIPFQYSLHRKASLEGELSHTGFLAETGIDPRPPLIESLLRDTPPPGDILAYNRSFEARVLRDLADAFPESASEIEDLSSRLVDLMEPFQKRYYYLPEMDGSYSIKAVLPALVPELSYETLEISEGTQAMEAYYQLGIETNPSIIDRIRNDLWEYCKFDTLAMVRILEKLEALMEQ
ncbi:MAG: hypothetical protein AMJ88_15525 [Anaerolineae bacterium SM23_ 63]|nr:MAG: hypothetical protein AMJ88_15525 [Anaerolineae bacterium SM23_ 63]